MLTIARRIWLLGLIGCGRIGFDSAPTTSGDAPALDAPMVKSCAGGLACGVASDLDCCGSPVVPGGMFSRSYDVAADGMYADPSFVAVVSAFRLDAFEVTVGRFRAFVAAGKGTQQSPPAIDDGAHANIPGSGWTAAMTARLPADTAELVAKISCNDATWTDAIGPNENRAINCVSRDEAMAFCAWDGGYLPTEAEWNFAAAGGSEQRAYPWSSPASSLTIDPTLASYNAEQMHFIVGAKPAGNGRWGHSDLAGGLWEWTLDRQISPYPSLTCTDCAVLTGGANWAVRGGSLFDTPANLRTGIRSRDNGVDPGMRQADIGVRCARPS